MSEQIDVLAFCRGGVAKVVAGLSPEALTTIPEGFNNHMHWQLGHIVVTQQLLCYKLSGLPMAVEDEVVELFMKGSKPREWGNVSLPSAERLVEQALGLVDKLRVDLDRGVFKDFQTYTTSTGYVLRSIEDAIAFNNFHEGVHLGEMRALRRLVQG
jgi:hypothetical protein